MIVINKGEINNIYLSISDVLPRDDGQYLIEATHKTTNKQVNMPVTRSNADVIRYDQFQIDETNYDLTEGFYDFEIKDEYGQVAEAGKMKVSGSDGDEYTEYQGDDSEYTMYNPSND